MDHDDFTFKAVVALHNGEVGMLGFCDTTITLRRIPEQIHEAAREMRLVPARGCTHGIDVSWISETHHEHGTQAVMLSLPEAELRALAERIQAFLKEPEPQ